MITELRTGCSGSHSEHNIRACDVEPIHGLNDCMSDSEYADSTAGQLSSVILVSGQW